MKRFFTLLIIATVFSCKKSNQVVSKDTNPVSTCFNIGTGFSSYVNVLDIQSDGKIIVGGDFITYNGENNFNLIRIGKDGKVDRSFWLATSARIGDISAILVLPNGKILIGNGSLSFFLTYGSPTIHRLNSDGTLDNTFNTGSGFSDVINESPAIKAFCLQPDGKIIVGGSFLRYNNVVSNNIVRLNTDGTRDNTFNIGSKINYMVTSIVLQNDGKIIVGGTFNNSMGNSITRLNSDGTKDNSFNIGTGFSSVVHSIVVQPDGKLLVGGNFDIYNGKVANGIIRLNADGSIDNTFNSGKGFDVSIPGSSFYYDQNSVNSIALQKDGKILCVGRFTSYNGTKANSIVRLNADGSIDNTFKTGDGFGWAIVRDVKVQSDGKIVIGGHFQSYDVFNSRFIIRLNSDGTSDNCL